MKLNFTEFIDKYYPDAISPLLGELTSIELNKLADEFYMFNVSRRNFTEYLPDKELLKKLKESYGVTE